MIQTEQYGLYDVPCKIRGTSIKETFTVCALNFEHACRILLFKLDNDWIIGYGSM